MLLYYIEQMFSVTVHRYFQRMFKTRNVLLSIRCIDNSVAGPSALLALKVSVVVHRLAPLEERRYYGDLQCVYLLIFGVVFICAVTSSNASLRKRLTRLL